MTLCVGVGFGVWASGLGTAAAAPAVEVVSLPEAEGPASLSFVWRRGGADGAPGAAALAAEALVLELRDRGWAATTWGGPSERVVSVTAPAAEAPEVVAAVAALLRQGPGEGALADAAARPARALPAALYGLPAPTAGPAEARAWLREVAGTPEVVAAGAVSTGGVRRAARALPRREAAPAAPFAVAPGEARVAGEAARVWWVAVHDAPAGGWLADAGADLALQALARRLSRTPGEAAALRVRLDGGRVADLLSLRADAGEAEAWARAEAEVARLRAEPPSEAEVAALLFPAEGPPAGWGLDPSDPAAAAGIRVLARLEGVAPPAPEVASAALRAQGATAAAVATADLFVGTRRAVVEGPPDVE